MQTNTNQKPTDKQKQALAGQYRAIGSGAIAAALLFIRRQQPATASAK